jgi:3-oxoadipate enol-lactonase
MGGDDVMITPAMAKFLHENIKGSKLEVIPDAGHVNMIEKPQEFNEVILRFMGDFT